MQIYMSVYVSLWSCMCTVLTFASLASLSERVLFVLALGLAPWKCWLAAMTQRYSIREGKRERERERGGGFGLSVPLGLTGCFFNYLLFEIFF